jgi:hypothetical protein
MNISSSILEIWNYLRIARTGLRTTNSPSIYRGRLRARLQVSPLNPGFRVSYLLPPER